MYCHVFHIECNRSNTSSSFSWIDVWILYAFDDSAEHVFTAMCFTLNATGPIPHPKSPGTLKWHTYMQRVFLNFASQLHHNHYRTKKKFTDIVPCSISESIYFITYKYCNSQYIIGKPYTPPYGLPYGVLPSTHSYNPPIHPYLESVCLSGPVATPNRRSIKSYVGSECDHHAGGM